MRLNWFKNVFSKVVFVVALIVIIYLGIDIYKHYESYDSVARYHLMLDLNNGDTEAIQYYNDCYIKDDIYLFDGDISYGLFADKYGLYGQEREDVYNYYLNSNMHLQQFVNEYKNLFIVAE